MTVVLVETWMIAAPVRANVAGRVPNREPRPSVDAPRCGLEVAEMPDRKMDEFVSPLRQNVHLNNG
jgi:hypothetical protein